MPEHKTIAEVLQDATTAFRLAGLETPQLDAKLLMQHVTGYSSAGLISNSRQVVEPAEFLAFKSVMNRRLAREPVHRITGQREFFGRMFVLSAQTLVPRPDTEILVETVLSDQPQKILEIGVGSGAIAVSLACELQQVQILASDISQNALDTASKNAMTHGVSDRIKFVQADVYDGVEGLFEAIVSNPPYIPSNDMALLQDEVRNHDPALALDGGQDGLDFYRRTLEKAPDFLTESGCVCLELGIGQAQAVSLIAKCAGFENIKIFKDLNGIERVLKARFEN